MGVQALWSSGFWGSSTVCSLPFLVREAPGAREKWTGLKDRSARKSIGWGDFSVACTASIFDAAGSPDGPVTQNPTDGVPKLPVSKNSRDAFRSAPPPELLNDEFFARMNLALEASRHSTFRASSTSTSSFFEGSSLNFNCNSPRATTTSTGGDGGDSATLPITTSPPELCDLPRGSVQLPSSIQKLRRRKGEPGCAIKRAFSSLVYMIKALQSHALQIRQLMFSEKWDVQEVLHLVHREMHASFVWLFQRVFACTPKFMLSVMILMANFTVFSMGENVAIATVVETPPAISQFLMAHGANPQLLPNVGLVKVDNASGERDAEVTSAGSGGRNLGGGPGCVVGEGFDEDAWLTGAMKEQVQLAREIETRRLVAPQLEKDSYGCFDRTELDYQLAIAKDPCSSVLLANYAQFLFVVRRDHNRAEEYFHRAMQADPRDSTILDRFASFLWLGRRDRLAAERVYKAAVAADPESSYSASSYAHFLWHAGDGDANPHGGRLAT